MKPLAVPPSEYGLRFAVHVGPTAVVDSQGIRYAMPAGACGIPATLHLYPDRVRIVTRGARFEATHQGFAALEYLASAIVDLELHLTGDDVTDASAFEHETVARLGMPRAIGMRHRMPQFLHAFGSDAYSASYNSYLWADVHAADAFEAFVETEDAYDVAVAKRLRMHVFSRGNTTDPVEAYRAFRGRNPEIGALLRKREFQREGSGARTGGS